MNSQKLPYWRLSGFYFFYFASLGALMPYLGLYLNSIGFVAAQVGVVFAVMQGTRLVSPSILAWISAGFNNRMRLIQAASLMSVATFSAFLFSQDFLVILLISFSFSFFWNAILPQFESVTLTMIGGKAGLYSGIRLWGSVGFIVTVAGIGYVLDLTALNVWPWLVAACLLLIFLSSLLLNENGRQKHADSGSSIYLILKQKKVIAFLLVVFLIQASHGAYYAFFSILLDELGYSEAGIGWLWSLGVFAEIVMFLAVQRIFKRISLRSLLLVSVFLTMVRWLLIAWIPDNLACLLVAQVLHAASFGAFHVVCIQLTHQYFQGASQDKGQAIYSSVGFGAGGMLGGLIAGLLWDEFGGAWVFTSAFFLSAIAFVVVWRCVERKNMDDLHASGSGVSSV